MSDSNQTGLYFTEEAGSWGTTPGVALAGLRFTGESLSYNIENIVSNEIRTDRQVTDLIQTGSENAGGFEFELSYSAFDDFMEGALWDDWTTDLGISLSTVAGTAVTIGSSSGTGFATTTASGFTGISAGDWIRVAGFTESGNNGFFQVSAIAASLDEILVSPAATAEAAGDTVTMSGSRIRNSTTEHSYTIERKHDDLSPDQYFSFAGMVCNQMRVSVQANSILTGSFDFLGKSCTQATASAGSGSFTDAPAYDVMNAVSNVGEIKEAGTTVASCLIQSIDFTVANKRAGPQIHRHPGQLRYRGGQGGCHRQPHRIFQGRIALHQVPQRHGDLPVLQGGGRRRQHLYLRFSAHQVRVRRGERGEPGPGTSWKTSPGGPSGTRPTDTRCRSPGLPEADPRAP